MIESWFTADVGLAGLFLASFLSATLLPGGSELVLFAVLKLYPQSFWPALMLASIGNTLGGLTSVAIGRLLPQLSNSRKDSRAMRFAQRFGAASLLLSSVPVIGDAICVAAGWLRLNWLAVSAFMAAGKFARYFIVAQLAGMTFSG